MNQPQDNPVVEYSDWQLLVLLGWSGFFAAPILIGMALVMILNS